MASQAPAAFAVPPKLGFALARRAPPQQRLPPPPLNEDRAQGGERRQYIAALNDGGSMELRAGDLDDGSRRRLVIPVAGAAAAGSTPPPSGERTLDQLAAEQIISDLASDSSLRAQHRRSSALVIPSTGSGSSASGSAGPTPPVDVDRPGARKQVDAALLAKLFNPQQKRVTGDPSAPPILSRSTRGGGAGASGGGAGNPSAAASGATDADKFSADLALRPADVSLGSEVYARVPIEEFGAAMLRGMGVAESVLAASEAGMEGDGLGAGGGGQMRQARQGLGASSGAKAVLNVISGGGSRPRPLKPGETRSIAPTLEELMRGNVEGGGAAGGSAKVSAAAAIRARKFPGLVTDAVVVVTVGRHTGKTALVTQSEGVPGMEKCRVRVCLRGRRNAYGLSAADAPARPPGAREEDAAPATAAAGGGGGDGGRGGSSSSSGAGPPGAAASGPGAPDASPPTRAGTMDVVRLPDGTVSWGGLTGTDTDVVVVGKAECRPLLPADGPQDAGSIARALALVPAPQRAEIEFLRAVEGIARAAVAEKERADRMALEARLRAEDDARRKSLVESRSSAAAAAAGAVSSVADDDRDNDAGRRGGGGDGHHADRENGLSSSSREGVATTAPSASRGGHPSPGLDRSAPPPMPAAFSSAQAHSSATRPGYDGRDTAPGNDRGDGERDHGQSGREHATRGDRRRSRSRSRERRPTDNGDDGGRHSHPHRDHPRDTSDRERNGGSTDHTSRSDRRGEGGRDDARDRDRRRQHDYRDAGRDCRDGRGGNNSHGNGTSTSSSGGTRNHDSSSSSSSAAAHGTNSSSVWLVPHIRVRVVDERSRYFKRKGVVLHVSPEGSATLLLDPSPEEEAASSSGAPPADRRELKGVPQQHLETALPKPGNPVLVVRGRGGVLGARGTLLSRNSQASRVSVRVAGSGAGGGGGGDHVREFEMDDVAEYVGGGEGEVTVIQKVT